MPIGRRRPRAGQGLGGRWAWVVEPVQLSHRRPSVLAIGVRPFATLAVMAYRRRVLDDTLDSFMPHLAAVAIEGAKGVGKTATARERCVTEIALDDPLQREALEVNLGLIADLEPPVLIDEWQLVPAVWDRVRREVDRDPRGGRFLLTGSATPPTGARVHSGAGRINSLLMRPMSMFERGLVEPTVSLRSLLNGERPPIAGVSPLGVADYVDEILRSGFPGMRDLPEQVRGAQLDSYLSRIVDRDLPEAGATVRRPRTLLAWLRAYGAATSTDASYTSILDAATAGIPDKPARRTTDVYRDHLERIFVLDPLPAWSPAFAPLKRLTLGPKHHVVDPALAARLVGVGSQGLLRGEGRTISEQTGTWLGALFESLVTQSVRVYAGAAGASVSHLRTKSTEHEIDLIVEAGDMSVVAIEVKLAGSLGDRDVRSVNWLHDQLGDRVVERVVLTTGPHAYRRPDGVAVIPFALLGP